MRIVEAIFEEFGPKYDIHLIPSRGGIFDVVVDGDLIYSKQETGRHAEYETDISPRLRTQEPAE